MKYLQVQFCLMRKEEKNGLPTRKGTNGYRYQLQTKKRRITQKSIIVQVGPLGLLAIKEPRNQLQMTTRYQPL